MKVTDEMVSRFLCWPLPKGFAPDCGVSFDGRKDDEWNKDKTWPVGTNLFTAEQARQMLEHVCASHTSAQAVPAETTLQRFDRLWEPKDGHDPVERLRFFCSLAMNGQDWLDVEPFFDALAAPVQAEAPTEPSGSEVKK